MQYLNFHLKIKVGALIGVLKEGYKNIAKMLPLHVSPKKIIIINSELHPG